MQAHYNIQISESVTNFNDGLVLLVNEIKRLHSWERQLFINELLARGYTCTQIAQLMHISKAAVSRFIPSRNSQNKTSGSPSQALGESRAACVPPEVLGEFKSKSSRKEK